MACTEEMQEMCNAHTWLSALRRCGNGCWWTHRELLVGP